MAASKKGQTSTLSSSTPLNSQRLIWSKQNLRELPKFRDGLSYLYLEYSRVEVQDRAITVLNPDGATDVPTAALGVLLLGPGTTVTHAAMKSLADGGCSVLWVGEDGTRFYAGGVGESRSSRGLQQQVRLWSDPDSHLQVVRKMYGLRFPEVLPDDLTLRQIRGREGAVAPPEHRGPFRRPRLATVLGSRGLGETLRCPGPPPPTGVSSLAGTIYARRPGRWERTAPRFRRCTGSREGRGRDPAAGRGCPRCPGQGVAEVQVVGPGEKLSLRRPQP